MLKLYAAANDGRKSKGRYRAVVVSILADVWGTRQEVVADWVVGERERDCE
jgi:hypothetical protein